MRILSVKNVYDKYYSRIVDNLLNKKLRTSCAVLIQGPKWCGKSTSASQIAKTIIYMQDPANMQQNSALAKATPSVFERGNSVAHR